MNSDKMILILNDFFKYYFSLIIFETLTKNMQLIFFFSLLSLKYMYTCFTYIGVFLK